MNRNELINYIILNSKISLEDIAQNIGVNRSNIYLWRTNKTKPKIEYVNKMANLAGITLKWINQNEIIIDNIDSDNVEMKNDSSKEKIISLQDETIKLQKEKISVLEKRLSNREATPSNFEMELDYHFEMNVKYEINWVKLSVDICFTKSSTNFDIIEGQLRYKKDELEKEIFAFGETYSFKKHPIQNIRSKAEQSKMLKKSVSMLKSIKQMNDEIKNWTINFPVIYRSKDGKDVHTMNSYIIDHYSKAAIAKIHFMSV